MLAFVASLGTWQSAKAQTQFFDDAITLTQQQTGGQATTVNYAGLALDAPYTGSSYVKLNKASSTTASPSLGSYDLNGTSQLRLTGGSIVADPPPTKRGVTYTITAARVKYRVYMRGAAVPNYTLTNSVNFPDAGQFGGIPNNGELYQNTSASVNLLSGLTIGGTYVLEVVFETDTNSSTNDTNTDADPGSTSYRAEFTLTAPPAPTLKGNAVYVTPNTGPNANTRLTYNVNSSTSPSFVGANLGGATYDINTGQLTLNGGMATTTEAGNSTVTNATLYYRVRLQGTGGGAFSFITLSQTSNNNGTRTFSATNSTINLVNSTSVTGTYNIDIYYQASGNNGTSNFTLLDDNSGGYYTANFTVDGTPIPATTWTGGLNDNWFQDGNWSNGIPTAGTNVTIRNFGAGTQNPYPRIFCQHHVCVHELEYPAADDYQ